MIENTQRTLHARQAACQLMLTLHQSDPAGLDLLRDDSLIGAHIKWIDKARAHQVASVIARSSEVIQSVPEPSVNALILIEGHTFPAKPSNCAGQNSVLGSESTEVQMAAEHDTQAVLCKLCRCSSTADMLFKEQSMSSGLCFQPYINTSLMLCEQLVDIPAATLTGCLLLRRTPW